MLKKILYLLALVLLCLACRRTDTSPDNNASFMVSIEPQRWMLEQLLPPGAQVGVLLPQGSDPETFDPTMQRRSQAADAEVYFATGMLPFEEKIHSAVKRYVNTGEGVIPIYGTHNHDHSELGHTPAGLPDPHVWTSVSGARQMALNMAGALCQAFPDSVDTYSRRLSSLLTRLDSLDAAIAQKVAGAHAFAIWHPSLSYFARDYGLHQIPLGSEGKDLSARGLKEAIDIAREDSCKVLFIQQEYDTRQAEAINDKIGSRLVVIQPMDYRWDKQMLLIADEIAR